MDNDWPDKMNEAYEILGAPSDDAILIVGDHASNRVPDDIDLAIDPVYLNDHIAVDIGTGQVAQYMTETRGFLAYLANVSRLVVDLNRYPDEAAAIVSSSDGIDIPGNQLTAPERQARIDRFHHRYHDRLRQLINDLQPRLIISLHSFTPQLRSEPELERPWDIGLLYNEYDFASRLAIGFLQEEGLKVGDQLPYSGKILNATMNRQAEAIGQPYIVVEIRQDLIADEIGQRRFANILLRCCRKVATALA